MSLLETRNLMKSFGGIRATSDLSLSVEPGELHAIIGPNGAGKTTLITQLCGTQAPDAGQVLFKGRDITALAPHKRARLGITRSFQITSLIADMTVVENIALAVQAREGSSFRFFRAADSIPATRAKAMDLLARVGLAEKAGMVTSALSHGEHRHMEIAIALASQAELMLLDEPMAGLGPEESARMVELLRGLKGRHTIVLIEHDMDAVFALADRISVLVYGTIIATGDPASIHANKEVEAAYLGEETHA
ncbi:ABC transporter ATP-binding protein [Vannielia litorea]|uniref:Amino acid/amide ABC transporter ATP-binding protein 1, HAAT family n=1 Tax=Vannielia litorea TaxID=1217970 RepID=A0A1N6IGI1_9RHOB|nr:ABC transporter ATP-binding protein [Vannielia litorea]SIO31144.1 amino acid/amide ABC transporter ATP-binding protein 1, HAAT family [Vannielia litorea]